MGLQDLKLLPSGFICIWDGSNISQPSSKQSGSHAGNFTASFQHCINNQLAVFLVDSNFIASNSNDLKDQFTQIRIIFCNHADLVCQDLIYH